MKQNLQYKLLSYNSRYSSFYQERESFYRSFINQYHLESAHKGLAPDNHSGSYLTNTIITPHDVPFGVSPRKLIWKIGMPSFQLKDINDFKDHKILFYRTKLLRQKVMIQFHFINGFFYYSQLSFLAFTEKTSSILSDSIKSKYNCSSALLDEDRVHMTDICGNRLIIEKGVYLTVSYLTGDNYPRTLMEEQLKLKKDHLSNADNYEINRLSKIL